MRFTVSKKIDNLGRIVIPKEMRDYYGIKLNYEVKLVPTEEGILIIGLAEEEASKNTAASNFEQKKV